jgi:hypothetical protein
MLAIPDKFIKSKIAQYVFVFNGTDSRKGYGYVYYGKQSKEKFL